MCSAFPKIVKQLKDLRINYQDRFKVFIKVNLLP